jgi:hypothetical protein
MLHTFTIPVKPHVRKYLEFHQGTSYKLSRLDSFGRELRRLLEQKKTNAYLDQFTSAYIDKFSVSVEGNLLLQKRLKALNSKEIVDFNNFVEGIIKTEFFGFVANCVLFKLTQYGSIQAFRQKYDFQDEDISYDTLKKAWQRYKKPAKKSKKKQAADPGNSINLVSVCPLPVQRQAA